ncbi:ferredoxin reductase family protein [Chelatococcus asaccharovorans]|mgnify:CR=1 FL=1|uniref:ferredoxin reductase family protein n=1 Tax=Chelatococcus asaccharovorans TaxID=28210 RepID=UPI00224C6A71|nr:ferric reductase-like transmembrane domain-containing protein [Chelatococcus asaccharovorans]CAH1659982.1 putative ferric reductase [Chelatococcus asaccharovorans]CAH1683981.1 putative ferric reductase [Chelatococcus asaccharovorans]
MRNIKRAFWATLVGLTLLWLLAEPTVFQSATFFGLRAAMMQVTGVLAIGSMSVAMVLALRPRSPERWLGGLDKMYRLHKWFGIAALVAAVVHWLWAQGPKWAVGWGWLERPVRGARRIVENPVEAFFLSLRGIAEAVGEWAFYAAVVLIVLALLRYFPYRLFYKTHRLLAVSYGVLAFHAVVLLDFRYWLAPLGWATAVLLAAGVWAAGIVLLRRVGADRQVEGTIVSFHHYPGVKSLETEIAVPRTWPGHKPGQFAFAMSDAAEGAHPYTIASSWHPENPRISFITRELGDHTGRLREKLKLGQEVRVEGPYGCFTFDDACPHQIWVGGGIGITPFIARMKHLAARNGEPDRLADQTIHLFHCTIDVDEKALEKLASDAKAANVRLHIVIDSRHGRLTGERIREVVPEWRDASIWFCGPTGFGHALRRDFAALGFPLNARFHQELFEMR